jgi:hypothetical protein
MLQAGHQFRRVNGRLHLLKLRTALEERLSTNVSAALEPDRVAN